MRQTAINTSFDLKKLITFLVIYSESTEALRRSSELGMQAGYQRRTREMLAWAKKRRRHIRREELIGFLTGKSLPGSGSSQPRHQMRMGPRQRVSLSDGVSASHGASPLQHPLETSSGDFEPALQAFREALSLPLPSPAPSNTTNSASSAKNAGRRGSPIHNHSELSAFISNESARHKRPAPASPSHDVIMDSPTHKRSRLM